MIKTALKHWIFELCIERLFDNIYKNFLTSYPCSDVHGLKKGQIYSHIEFTPKYKESDWGIDFFDCKISKVCKASGRVYFYANEYSKFTRDGECTENMLSKGENIQYLAHITKIEI